jgi:hypothetical protein
LRRQLDSEATLELLHVGEIFFLRYVTAGVAVDCDLRRQAAHFDSFHLPAARETTRRENPDVAVLHSIIPVSFVVEFHYVDIDLASAIVREHEILRSAAILLVKSMSLEKLGQRANVGLCDNDVHILVSARLGLEQRVDSPSAVEPDLDPGLVKPGEDFYQSFCGHREVNNKGKNTWSGLEVRVVGCVMKCEFASHATDIANLQL